jgi:pimeloyl-ACP methyl ester carboxylesterase
MRVALRDGVRLFVDVDGASLRPDGRVMRLLPTLILLHGGPGFDHSPFKVFFSRFVDRCQVVYYDHRGMGRSDAGPEERWNLATWADDLGELVDTLGIDRPIVVGQSFGGFVALEYAARASARLGGLVLSSTAARHVRGDCLEMFERLGGDQARDAAQAFFDDPGPQTFERFQSTCMPLYNTTAQDPQVRERQLLTPDVLFRFWRGEHARFDLRGQLDKIACPTLVVVGEQDPITPVPRSVEIADAFDPALARLAIVPDAGHGVYRDLPDDFASLLGEFLASLEDR